MKILYLDCQSGISGDMTLAALIDLGADIVYIREQLEKLPIEPFSLSVKQVNKKGISSKKLDLNFEQAVWSDLHSESHPLNDYHYEDQGYKDRRSQHGYQYHSDGHVHSHDKHGYSQEVHHSRKAASILEMIKSSELPKRVKRRSSTVFQMIAEAEGEIHGMDPKDVHFHEVGAMDSIIDVIGVCLALENLGIDKIISSPVPTGYGKVMMAHGLYPIPAPATAEILKGVPLADFYVKGELTTPTGAAFVKVLADEYGHIPALSIERIGYGAGIKDFAHPNVLRAILFQAAGVSQREAVIVLECQLDDMTGEALGYTLDRVLDQGALDVFFTPVSMKKSRPGILLTVLVKPEGASAVEELLLRETSTFGVRWSEWSRRVLSRRFEKVDTPYGQLTAKIGFDGSEIYKITPEYEEAKKAAIQNNIPLLEVYSAVQIAAKQQIKNGGYPS